DKKHDHGGRAAKCRKNGPGNRDLDTVDAFDCLREECTLGAEGDPDQRVEDGDTQGGDPP
ncbi:hypothetical protein, partial [Ralstonia pseudosolanacearum]